MPTAEERLRTLGITLPEIGRHARTALGAAELPNDYPVAFDLVVAFDA